MLALGIVITGFITHLSQIIVIGPQNTFVIRSGMDKKNIWGVVSICIFFDILMICMVMFGLISIISNSPLILKIFQYSGSAFLFWYGGKSINKSVKAKSITGLLHVVDQKSLLIMALSVSILNPGAWMDTIVIGAFGSKYTIGIERILFYIGTVLSSCVWFISIGYGARFLTKPLHSKTAWVIIDFFVGVWMIYLGFKLLSGA